MLKYESTIIYNYLERGSISLFYNGILYPSVKNKYWIVTTTETGKRKIKSEWYCYLHVGKRSTVQKSILLRMFIFCDNALLSFCFNKKINFFSFVSYSY